MFKLTKSIQYTIGLAEKIRPCIIHLFYQLFIVFLFFRLELYFLSKMWLVEEI